MKVLLVKPPVKTDVIIPPLGLGYIASALEKPHEVEIIDCNREKINIASFLKRFKKYSPDITGFQVFNNDKSIVKKMMKGIKKIKPSVITVAGGPYPSCESYEVFKYFGDCLDFAFQGEAEKGFEEMVNALSEKGSLERVKGLIWREKKAVRVNPPYHEKKLDNIADSSWDLLRPHSYPPAPIGAFLKKYPAAPISVSRGCPYKCSFCAGWRITGRKVRYRSVERVVAEIEKLNKKYGVEEIHIIDDNFSYSREYVIKFCREMIKRKRLGIKLACPNGLRIDSLDRETVDLMKQAGFYAVHFGIESGSQKVLNYMGKSLSIKEIESRIKEISSAGLLVCGYFIMGFPGESARDIRKTLKIALRLPLSRAMFMNYMPIPGTVMYKALDETRIPDGKCSNKASFYRVNYKINISAGLQKIYHLAAFLLFYLRPKIFFKNLKFIYNYKHFYYLLKRIFRIIIYV